MRSYLFVPIILACTLLFSESCKGNKLSETGNISDEYYLAYSGNFHEEIIKPEVQAWQKVAKEIYPRVCDDTETQWAALQADSLGNVLLSQKSLSDGEQLARLYEIQNMIAYGMSYFSAIIGAYTNPNASEAARMMMQSSYAEIDSLRSTDYKNARMLVAFEQTTYANFGLFMELGTQYSDGEPQFVTNNQEMNALNNAKINVLFKEEKDSVQAFRYSTLINNTTFFMTYCPLAFWLAGSDFQQENQAEYIKIGGWFDEQASEVNKAIIANDITHLPKMSSDTYSEIVKQASEYRVCLIQLLEKGITSIPFEQ